MKVRFFVDLWPGMDPVKYPLQATTSPGAKREGVKRLSFEVSVPDRFIFGIDAELYDVTDAREVKNGHVLYTTKDKDAPDCIRDRNGEVALGMCKLCHKVEAELGVQCIGAQNATKT